MDHENEVADMEKAMAFWDTLLIRCILLMGQSKAKKGRGKAMGIEFERLRKNGQIPVKGDFVLDWTGLKTESASRQDWPTVTSLIITSFHKIYKRFQNKEKQWPIPQELSKEVWEKSCNLRANDDYQRLCDKNVANRRKLKVNHTAGSKSLLSLYEESLEEDCNKIQFYKRSHIKRDLVTWVTSACEENYNQMIAAFAKRDPSMKSVKIAEEVFYEVLGHARGMGKFVIPPPSTSARSSQSRSSKRASRKVAWSLTRNNMKM
ncbi:hypothetical protein CJ030_MR7G027912 [Morella rubra]|uniref:Uncharacterized protein n=1 Tax=Morella rubra TaxID=262757 RepID=A0A6A1UZU5_9ROSI|nr:hypothetical protein CJ030_MR7G027912 [Morella rubra]